jgi:hypothetical protein
MDVEWIRCTLTLDPSLIPAFHRLFGTTLLCLLQVSLTVSQASTGTKWAAQLTATEGSSRHLSLVNSSPSGGSRGSR